MTRTKVRWMLMNAAGLLVLSLFSAALAKDELPKSVRNVLSEESQFSRSSWNRRQQLGAELVKAKHSDDVLRWQAGFVKVNGKWLPFEESFSPEPLSGRGREYLDRRSQSEHTWPSQTALANWCAQHAFAEQSQAHNYHSLMFAPKGADFGETYQRMGFVLVGSQWLSRQEAIEAQRELFDFLDKLESGTPTVLRFVEELEANRFTESSRRERLKRLAMANKIAALEVVLAPRSERCGQAAVEALRQIPSYQASQALGRIAAHSPWLFVRDSALEGLRDRRWEDFIPQWLSMLQTPITTEYQRVAWGRHQGILCLYRSERDFEIEVGQLLIWATSRTRQAIGPRDAAQLANYQSNVAHVLQQRAERVRRLCDVRADEIEQLNERIAEALRTTTQHKWVDSPKDWWDWWQVHSGLSLVPSHAKPLVVVVKEDNQVRVPPPPPPVMSCLVAGTPVWTERGLVAVERILPGDRVLSKHIESGELAYKVVLHTTVREPFPVMTFSVGDEIIQATEGHHFWVSGRGWTKTRELAAEQPLHTPTGAIRIGAVESAESAPTYNLVVADFHTYFVGKSAILSHDVLPPKPTNKVVPGLGDD